MGLDTRVRVGIIGAGNMGQEHARAFASVDGAHLVGVCSRTRSSADALAARFAIATVCDSVAELFDRAKPDIVVVAVPELAMSPVSRACFAFPWLVLLEKPAGYCLSEAQAI